MGTPVEKVLKFKDNGISVEEARRQMLASGHAPRGIASEAKKNAAVGGNVSVADSIIPAASAVPSAPAAPAKKYPTSAYITLINEDGTDSEPALVKADTPQLLEIELQKIHTRAMGAKRKIRVDLVDPDESIPASVPVKAPVTPAAAAPASTAPVTESGRPQTLKFENAKFSGEIRQEDGQWVAELIYKNGAGTERFEAPSRLELDRKLLEGKGNATLRVRESIRREKYGTDLDKNYTLPDNLKQEVFDALPKEGKDLIVDAIAANQALILVNTHPEYYITENNSDRIQRFLAHKKLPFTARNMEFAYEELAESDPEFDARPRKEIVSVSSLVPTVPATASVVEDSTPTTAASASVPTAAVPAAPAPAVRKRGTTGLQPGYSSSPNSELETVQEDGSKSRELSAAELRKLPLSELKARSRASLKSNRQF